MIDTKALRSRILDLAIQGMLTQQLAEDDDVSAVLKAVPAISAKRKTLLKKHFDYDFSFDIPTNWKWVRLGEISSYGDSPTKAMTAEMNPDTWILELEDIKSGGELLQKKRVGKSTSIGEKTVFSKGQVLYSKLRPYLKKVLVADEDGISTPELISFDIYADISAKYIVFCLINSFVDNAINKRSYGVKMPRVDVGFMVNLPIPLPPLAEQKRIVQRVEEIFKLLDTIDEAQEKYSADTEILKAKLITAGIQGKLTQQLPSDGTAEDLLMRISAEKQALIKEGKIPKERALPEIDYDECPFKIPDSWRWVRVQDVASYITDYVANGSFATLKAHTKTYKEPNYAIFVRTMDLSSDFKNDCSYIDKASYDFLEKSKLYGGELILPNIGASIGKAFIMPDLKMPMSLAPNSILLKFTDPVMNLYFSYVIKSKFGSALLNTTQGGSATAKFSKTDLRSLIVPLPPLAEQKRIAETLEKVLGALA